MGVFLKTSEETLGRYAEYLIVRNYSPATSKRYQAEVKKFFVWLLEKKGIERLQDVTKEVLRDFQNKVFVQRRQRDGAPLSLSMKIGKIVALKNFFQFLIQKGDLLYNPADSIDVPRQRQDKLKSVLKEREVLKILGSVKGEDPLALRDRAILELLYSTGIRNSEARLLEPKDVDFEGGLVRIRHGKGYFGPKERVVPLGRMAGGFLEEYLQRSRPKILKGRDSKFLFVSHQAKGLSIYWLLDLVKKYSKCLKKNVTTHMLRHSFATHLLRHGADIRHVQMMLGHENLDSTKIYTKLEITDLKKVHQKTHPRERM